MKRSKDLRWMSAAMIAILVLAVLGVAGSTVIAMNDPKGFEGLWEKKKGMIRSVNPEIAPAMDEAERAVRSSWKTSVERP